MTDTRKPGGDSPDRRPLTPLMLRLLQQAYEWPEGIRYDGPKRNVAWLLTDRGLLHHDLIDLWTITEAGRAALGQPPPAKEDDHG